jgi:glycosyltransferase involved in cell wall biosynthesis
VRHNARSKTRKRTKENSILFNNKTPAIKNGYITFGSFNNIKKINKHVIKIWSKILCNSESKLFLKTKELDDQTLKKIFKNYFLENGVKEDQLIFEESSDRVELLSRYNLIDLALDLNISENINWNGKVTNVNDVLKNINVFVLTSKYEGFGLVLLEAMKAKIPILASNTSAIPEVLGVNYPGLFNVGGVEDLVSKMKLTFDRNYLEHLLTFYPARLEIFESSKMFNEVNNVYDNAVESRSTVN